MRLTRLTRSLATAAMLASLALPTPAGAQAPASTSAGSRPAPPAPAAAAAPAAAPSIETLFKKFGEAAKAGDWPKAYELMQDALALQKTYDVLGNLGTTEMQLGKYRDAGEHLARSLHLFPVIGKPEVKKQTEELLAKAMAQVGTLRLKVSPSQTRLRVGERVYGPEEYRELVFVEAGEVTVSAGDAQGYAPEQRRVRVEKGTTVEVELALKPEGPAASASGGPSGGPAGTVRTPGPNKGVVIAGASATLVGLALGIGLLVASFDKRGEADKIRDGLLMEGRKVCAPGSPAADCTKFVSAGNTSTTLGDAGGTLLIGAGLAGAATLIYYFVARPQRAAPPPIKVGLGVGPDGGALSFQGKF